MIRPLPEKMLSSIRNRRSADFKKPLIAKDNEIFANEHVLIKMNQNVHQVNSNTESNSSKNSQSNTKTNIILRSNSSAIDTTLKPWRFEWTTKTNKNMDSIQKDLTVYLPIGFSNPRRQAPVWYTVMKKIGWNAHFGTTDFNDIVQNIKNPDMQQLTMNINVRVSKTLDARSFMNEVFDVGNSLFSDLAPAQEWSNVWNITTFGTNEFHIHVSVTPPKQLITIVNNKNWNLVMKHIDWNKHMAEFNWTSYFRSRGKRIPFELKLKLTVQVNSGRSIPINEIPSKSSNEVPETTIPPQSQNEVPKNNSSVKKNRLYPQILVAADYEYFK